ncbi:ectoine synthase [Mesorhizobium sp. STM 4661]|uniref:ectoine synthase n=1 Tax=Mesorhizobium sp. STM 4661 TaxID=1297570 RepID=UPI0002BF1F5D|nr:ectoine synthase [Mesorhizobium sp. STM 4661]CCV12332.1 hypothetical protein MESS4_40017 [Mesorhizobium sp. STM 4661]
MHSLHENYLNKSPSEPRTENGAAASGLLLHRGMRDRRDPPDPPVADYTLEKHNSHIPRADVYKPMIMACVFNPPVTGSEIHQEDGSCALEAE